MSWALPQTQPASPGGSGATAGAAGDDLEVRLREMYGAVLVAQGGAVPPPGILFANEEAVAGWQAGVPTESATLGGIVIELQTPAMQALLAARDEMRKAKLAVTPRTRTAARRSYAHTVRFWRVRVDADLRYWKNKGRISRQEAQRIRKLGPLEQVPEILRLEGEGMFFGRNHKQSILTSVAPPGASQHLAMLALDIKEHDRAKIRAILARHGWFQTILGDLPHFTFLGSQEEELPALGLKRITLAQRVYWVPDRTTP